MTYSIPSSISPVLSGNFRLQAFYVGDLGGQLWAFNIPDGVAPYDNAGKSNWTGCRVFDSDASTTAPLNIFFPPAISYDASGNLWLYFGTGDRENLTAVNTTRDNELIGLNTIGTQGVGECAAKGGPYNETNLTNETNTSGIGTVTSDGWYITLSQGEKAVGSPLVYDQIVYFVTYTPSASSAACGYGTAKLYAVYYLNGGGTITTSNTISNTATSGAQSETIGSGVPSAPVISNGNLIITTSTGAILTQKIPSLPSKLTPTSWFQLP
jgi:Tfp pilus tip-associated adhesin PilY1